jgi:bla regulator protein blaR1
MSLLPFLQALALKSTIILIFAFVVIGLMRRLSSEGRHIVWSFTFLALLALPMLLWVLPKIELPAQATQVLAFQSLPLKGEPSTLPVAHQNQNLNIIPDNPAGRLEVNTSVSISVIAGVSYSVISLALLLYLLTFIFRVSRSLLNMLPCSDPESHVLLQSSRQKLNIKRSVALRISYLDKTPWTWCVFSPVIVLPQDFKQWSTEDKQNAFTHELAHIKRFDILTTVLAKMVCCLYWFNPLVWLAYKLMNREAEQSCDNLVILSGAKSAGYANQLLSVARSIYQDFHRSGTAPSRLDTVPSMARSTFLSHRIKAILDPKLRRSSVKKTTLSSAFIITLALSIPLGAVTTASNSSTSAGDIAASQKTAVERRQSPAQRPMITVNENSDKASGIKKEGSDTQRIFVPLFKESPIYPQDALANKTQGYVVVEYDIQVTGQVNNVSVVDASPKGVFDQVSIDAAKTFLYLPKLVDGKKVVSQGVQNKFVFTVDKPDALHSELDEQYYQQLLKNGPADIEEVLVVANGHIRKQMPQKATQLLVSQITHHHSTEPRIFDLLNEAVRAETDAQRKQRNKTIGELRQKILQEQKGEAHIQLARLYLNSEDWQSAFAHLVLGFELGELNNPEQARMDLGTVLFRMGRLNDAKLVFDKLKENADTQNGRLAMQWSQYLQQQALRMDDIGAAVLRSSAL